MAWPGATAAIPATAGGTRRTVAGRPSLSLAVRLSGTGTLTAPATAAARAAAAEVGRRLAADLLANGADSVLGSAR